MKIIGLSIVLILSVITANSQSLKKLQIKNDSFESGCSLYSFCDLEFETKYSEDSSLIFTSECTVDSFNIGVICVKLREPSQTPEEAEELVIAYLDFLKNQLSIVESAGYGRGWLLRNNDNTRGVLDYWVDNENYNWKVKAWTDKNNIVVLFAFSQKELNESRVDVYLNSLLFPGM